MEELTVGQAAEVAGHHPRTIEKAITAGRLPATKRGYWYFIRTDDVIEYRRRYGWRRPGRPARAEP